ncbi:MAG: UDP-N-acetylmuramate dehydrogenase [Myxococcales bacterium]|nr:MAG: UDP-N-acetylmuramate dehydrogenase [Myxococcales bacterium]
MNTLDIQRNVPLAPLTTLELGGAAKHFVRVQSEPALIDALHWATARDCPVAILGGGSNLIVPDEGYDGLVVQLGMSDLTFRDGGLIQAGAGVPWEDVVDGAVFRGWAGVECLTGIPGSTGATPIQNVGAYGQEVAGVIDRVRVVRRDTLEAEELNPSECELDYRNSVFKRHPDRFVVTGVDFALRPDGPPSIRYAELQDNVAAHASLGDVRRAVLELRKRKSMVLDRGDANHRSAGSFFLNPVVPTNQAETLVERAVDEGLVTTASEVPRYPAQEGRTKLAAGWLIEKAGIAKGTRRGAIGVSTNHALALVHHGGGTTAELLAFAEEIRARVRDRFGVDLEREPRLLQ